MHLDDVLTTGEIALFDIKEKVFSVPANKPRLDGLRHNARLQKQVLHSLTGENRRNQHRLNLPRTNTERKRMLRATMRATGFRLLLEDFDLHISHFLKD